MVTIDSHPGDRSSACDNLDNVPVPVLYSHDDTYTVRALFSKLKMNHRKNLTDHIQHKTRISHLSSLC